jgi:23S rRNA (adenine2503-C2)-methyltransferase
MSSLELPLALTASPKAFLDVPNDEFRSWLQERHQAPMRLKQIRRRLIVARAQTFDDMTELPLSLRRELADSFTLFSSTIDRALVSSDGTEKLLLRLADGNLIECVLLKEADRRTVCISTQVGCGMGCVFCASGINGVVRNLRPSEILEQLLHARNRLPAEERLTHVVVMGMGEPMANLESLLETLEIACSSEGLGMSARHIHISTVGIPGKIRKLADLGKQYHLAVSLHAPNDALRTQIVPTNDKIGLAEILDAAEYFQEKTGRQVTYEYVMLREVNDLASHAAELGRLLRGRGAHVNLIPFNDVSDLQYRRPREEVLRDFVDILKQHRVSVKVRKRKGADIDAACGQLRRDRLAEVKNLESEPILSSGV